MIRLGVIGCGGIAEHQLNSIWDEGLFELVAGCDIRPERLDLFREKFGMQQGWSDYRKMLEEASMDAVMICTPTWLHAENVIAAAEAGLPIFCQKPMAMSSYDCYRMIRTCEKHGVQLQLGFVRRFDTDWGVLKDVIDSGVLGAPVLWRQIAGGPGPKRPFFLDRFEGGGPMIDGMVHNYDFGYVCFGEPVEVKSMPMLVLGPAGRCAYELRHRGPRPQRRPVLSRELRPGQSRRQIRSADGRCVPAAAGGRRRTRHSVQETEHVPRRNAPLRRMGPERRHTESERPGRLARHSGSGTCAFRRRPRVSLRRAAMCPPNRLTSRPGL